MRLTQRQLRRLLAEETRRALREDRGIDSLDSIGGAATNPIQQTNTGDEGAQAMLHAFMKALHDGGFEDFMRAARVLHKAWGKKEIAAAKETNESVVRRYVRMVLLEMKGDANDFGMMFPALNTLAAFYSAGREKLWSRTYTADMRRAIDDAAEETYNVDLEDRDARNGYEAFLNAMQTSDVAPKSGITKGVRGAIERLLIELDELGQDAPAAAAQEAEEFRGTFSRALKVLTGALRGVGPDMGTGFGSR